jgi:hypothetical protein
MMESEGYELSWKDHIRDVFGEIKKLRGRDYFSDVILHCGGSNFSAHKVILAASSTFFERVLTGVPRDRSQVLVMSDLDPDLLERILDFIYDGTAFVPTDVIDKFISTAETLEIRGLGKNKSSERTTTTTSEPSRRPRPPRKRPVTDVVAPVAELGLAMSSGNDQGVESSLKKRRPADMKFVPKSCASGEVASTGCDVNNETVARTSDPLKTVSC